MSLLHTTKPQISSLHLQEKKHFQAVSVFSMKGAFDKPWLCEFLRYLKYQSDWVFVIFKTKNQIWNWYISEKEQQ